QSPQRSASSDLSANGVGIIQRDTNNQMRFHTVRVSSVQNICGTPAAYVRFALAALYLRFGPKADLGTAATEASQKACRCVSALSQRWAGRKYFVGILSHYGVALAADVFERRAIQDLDVTAPVADQAGALQEARRDGHCGAPHAEHLPEKLLR